MEKNFTILSIKKYHTFSQLKEQQLHNNRAIPSMNVDSSLSILNKNLINDGLDYSFVWKKRIREAEIESGQKIKVRNNAVIAFEIVLSYSNEQTANIPIDEWANENVEWLKNTFGEKNILAATLHMDEQTPHIHAEIIPIDDRNKLCAKTFIPGKAALFQLHNSYAECMKPFGLSRGQKHSKAKKKDLNEFYDSINQAMQSKLPDRLMNESEEEYIKRLEKYLQTLNLAVVKQQLEIEELKNNLDTSVFNTFLKYQTAIDLVADISESYDDDEFTEQRLYDYRLLEKTVPKNILDKVITELKNKFITQDNLLSILPDRQELRKRKKYKQNQNTENINH